MIRVAQPADAAALIEIYAPYVTDTVVTFDYEIPSVADFSHRIETILAEYPYLVAEDEKGTLIGYAYAHAYKERAAYDWAVEVSVYVAQSARGQGVGRRLYTALEQELKKQNIRCLTACITGENEASIAFHLLFGYEKVAEFPQIGYKFGTWHDVVWLQKQVETAQEALVPRIPYREFL